MTESRKGFFYSLIMFGFFIASKLMHQKPHLEGRGYLKDIPTPILFTVTHDSYAEVPSLSWVYYALKPKPNFLIMAKNEFLSGRYLSTNYAKNNRFIRSILLFLDTTGLPLAIFRTLNLSSVERPFIEQISMKKPELKNTISGQLNQFSQGAERGLSTLIFPEGTTWGYGGLKKIRSGVYQIVESTFQAVNKKVYVLPINVKMDRLAKGAKDVFINVGKPFFMRKPKEEFNRAIHETLQSLHTITFSQIASFYFRCRAEIMTTAENVAVEKEKFITEIEKITHDIHEQVTARVLPYMDSTLLNHDYLLRKVDHFLKYLRKTNYIQEIRQRGHSAILVVNCEKILADYAPKEYRKRNPLGYHANELTSLGEDIIRSIYDRYLVAG
ncbi:MAG: 1-acyl-sn-glycerol-3-phosphate acyltransferase [Deltaproteobacteria bacterium]|nr:1-acyl-sn-glycerol-3-phosphate acyltransferase [Deltaproteobacteria bacterium]